ncbi:MAG: hypothetical protein PWP65_1567 [Clostridia bacterium]|nr:hypothetical protein [Clostridia bacterium]
MPSNKWSVLVKIAKAYARLEDVFLLEYGHVRYRYYLDKKRALRDELGFRQFCEPLWAPGPHVEAGDGGWPLHAGEAVGGRHRSCEEFGSPPEGFTREERHYAFWLLYEPSLEAHRGRFHWGGRDWRKDSPGRGQEQVRNYLKRVFRRAGRDPGCKRSAAWP